MSQEQDPRVEDEAESEYPPETYRLMSWAAIRFIHRPRSTPVVWATILVLLLIVAAVVASFFIDIDVRAEAEGDIVTQPEALSVLARAEGLLESVREKPGSKVRKGQVLGTLEMDIPSKKIVDCLGALDRSRVLLESMTPTRATLPKLDTCPAADDIRDESVRRPASALRAELRRQLTGGLPDEAVERSRSDLYIHTQALIAGLEDYRASHELISPSDGVLMQYQIPINASVRKGDVVAYILPEGANLVARLELSQRDIPLVSPGQDVHHSVEAFPSRTYGLFEGVVKSIEQQEKEEGRLRYIAITSINRPPHLPARLTRTLRWERGMRVKSSIVTGKRTLFDALVDAIMGGK